MGLYQSNDSANLVWRINFPDKKRQASKFEHWAASAAVDQDVEHVTCKRFVAITLVNHQGLQSGGS